MSGPHMEAPHSIPASEAQGQSKADTPIIGDEYTAGKTLATLTTHAARACYEVRPLSDCSYLVCRWHLSRACPDIRSLSTFLHMLGVFR